MMGYRSDEIEKQKLVDSWLEDEQSRIIFRERIQFNLDKEFSHIQKILDLFVPELAENRWYPEKDKELIRTIHKRKKKVVVFGAGYWGRGKILNLCVEGNVKIEYFCDSDKEKQGTTIQGITVISPSELEELNNGVDYIVIIGTKYAHDEIYDMLVHIGIASENIYKFVDYTVLSLKTQYFDESLLTFKNDEIFVDGGCFDFWTSRLFLEKMNKLGLHYKKIYAFEPDAANMQKCKSNIEKLGIDNVELIEAGLWKYDGQLDFSQQGNGSSHVFIQDNSEANKVKVVALDTYIRDSVSFIKMDIEGAELEALKGAEYLIKRDKPKLAICLYHKKEDIWEIPYYIKTLVPEYKLYMRHYSNCENETVLYAACD